MVTLAVTLLRLAGELRGWDPRWFGTKAGGGWAVVGITWLVPVFGFVFGRNLARRGERPERTRRAWLWTGAGIAVVAAGFVIVDRWIGVRPPGMAVGAGGSVLGGALAWRGWPRLARINFAYSIGARVPIVVLTAIAIAGDWGTHYEKLAEDAPVVGDAARFAILTLAQATFWLPITVLLGGVGGLIASACTRTDGAARTDPGDRS